jgi:hypothetical protein
MDMDWSELNNIIREVVRDEVQNSHRIGVGDRGELYEFISQAVRDETRMLLLNQEQAERSQHDPGLSLEAFKKNIETELGLILRVWAPANIRTYVQEKVETSAFELVMTALGFEKNWDKWVLKSGGGTEAMKEILEAARETIKEWFAQQLGELPDLPKTVKDSVIKEYKQHLEQELRKRMKEEATKQARLKVERMIAQINKKEKA